LWKDPSSSPVTPRSVNARRVSFKWCAGEDTEDFVFHTLLTEVGGSIEYTDLSFAILIVAKVGCRVGKAASTDSQEFPNRLRDQLFFPVLYRRRLVARQQRDEGEQRQSRIAQGGSKTHPSSRCLRRRG
jgi:hypothetical protein